MKFAGLARLGSFLILALALTACSNNGLFGKKNTNQEKKPQSSINQETEERETIWDLFENRDNSESPVRANSYIWIAALDILDFMPVEAIDPFTGIIETGWGTPPGGNQQYQATVVVSDTALDARSLKVALRTRRGLADSDTTRAVEDAILSRARQLRVEKLSY